MSRVKGWFLRRWPALLSAVLLLLAFPPFDIWPLIFVGMAPLLWQLRSLNLEPVGGPLPLGRSSKPRSAGKEAWRIGYLFGFIYFLGQMAWLFGFVLHWTANFWLSALPWVAGSLFGAVYFGWVCVLMQKCFARNWPWMVPFIWAGVEVVRSFMPVLAFPWGFMGTPLYGLPALIQLAHFGTLYMVSAWVVLANVLLSLGFDGRAPAVRWLRPLGVTFAGLLVISCLQLTANSASDPFPVTVGQPAVDLAYGPEDGRAPKIAESVGAITNEAVANHSKLLILPEGIGDDNHFPPITPFAINPRLPVLFGGQRFTDDAVYQTSFSYDGHWEYADKTRLVIFGEFVPGRSIFPGLAKAFDLPAGDLSAGRDGVRALNVAGVRVGPLLCFEGLFPDISYRQALNGSRFLATMSIDDWYMGTPAPEQLMAGSIFRAVETGLPLVRSASLGHTMVLDAHGRILSRLPLGKPGVLHTTLQLPRQSPLFPLLPAFPVGTMLAAITLPWWPRRRSA